MEQAMSSIILTLFVMLLFIPTIFLKTEIANNDTIKSSMSFATTALADCIEISDVNLEDLSLEYQRYIQSFDAKKSEIKIDEPKLLVEFNNVLFKNFQNPELYAKIQSNVVAKILVYNNKFVISSAEYDYMKDNYDYKAEIDKYFAGDVGKFNAPYYFTYEAGGRVYYLNTKNNTVLYREFGEDPADGVKKFMEKATTTSAIGLSDLAKNKLIIDKINNVVAHYADGLVINFPNPADENQMRTSLWKDDINFFDGVTFFVIYKSQDSLVIRSKSMVFKNYALVGYTLK